MTLVSKPLIAHGVPLVGSVLTAIDFDDETLFTANEIDDVGADRLLTDEFVPIERAGAQAIPQARFGFGGIEPEVSGTGRFYNFRTAHRGEPPSPAALCAATSPRKAGER